MKRIILIALLAACLAAGTTGCRVLAGAPMVQRLSPEEQKMADSAWDNLLNPVGRVDRGLLLDVITAFGFVEDGVDRLTLCSEKHFAGGKVVMNINFVRETPEADRLSIEVFDRDGKLVRCESYGGDEVRKNANDLSSLAMGGAGGHPATSPSTQPTTAPATERAETPEESTFREARERRMNRIIAATQPVK